MGQKTTTRHKESNTFKFQSFAEKLRVINASISANFRSEFSAGLLDEANERESQLAQAIEKWSQLNLTSSFDKLTAEIGYDVRITAQVLHDKDRLIGVLLNHITTEEVASFDATSEVLIALCLDLGVYFHPSLPNFIEAISKVVMESGQPDVIEKGFQTMGYLFKYGRQHVLRNFSSYFELMVPLLTSKKKGYLKVFVAQTLELVALTMWKTSRAKLFDWFANHFLPKYTEVTEGIAMLLFSMMKGTSDLLKISGGDEFKDCLTLIQILSGESLDLWKEVVVRSMELLVPSLNKDGFKILFSILRGELEKTVKSRHSSFPSLLTILRTLIVSSDALDVREELESIYAIDCLTPDLFSSSNTQSILTDIVIHIINSNPKFCLGFQNYILQIIKFPGLDVTVLRNLDNSLMQHPQYLIRYITPIAAATGDGYLSHFGAHFMLGKEDKVKCDFEGAASIEFTELGLPMYCMKYLNNFRPTIQVEDSLQECLKSALQLLKETEVCRGTFQEIASMLLFASRATSKVGSHHWQTCLAQSETAIRFLYNKYLSTDKSNEETPSLWYMKSIYLQVEARTYKTYTTPAYPALGWDVLILLMKFAKDELAIPQNSSVIPWLLKTLDCVLAQMVQIELSTSQILEVEQLNLPGLLPVFLNSPLKFHRSVALSILCNVIRIVEVDSDQLIVFSACLEIECMNCVLPAYGSFVSLRLEEVQRRLTASNDAMFLELVFSYILGLLNINFSETWPKCHKLIKFCWEKDLKTATIVLNRHYNTGMKEYEYVEKVLSGLYSVAGDEPTEFESSFVQSAFLLSRDEPVRGSKEEMLDRLWPGLIGLDENKSSSKVNLQFLLNCASDILEDVCKEIPFRGVRLDNPSRINALPSILQFIAKAVQLRSCLSSAFIERLVSNMLFTKNLAIMKTAMTALIGIKKSLEPYREHLIELCDPMYNPHGFLVEAVEPIIKKAKDREIVMDVVVKVLAQTYHAKTKKGKFALLNTIAGFTERDAKLFLDLTVGSMQFWESDGFPASLPYIQGALQTISKVLSCWKYRFPSLISYLLQLVCLMVNAGNTRGIIPNLKDTDDEFLERKKKAVIGSGLSCIFLIFKEFTKLKYTEADIEHVFTCFIARLLPELANMSTGGESTFLRLLLLLAEVKRYNVLLTKYVFPLEYYDSIDDEPALRKSAEKRTAMDEIFRLIKDPKVHGSVKTVIMSTFLNLVPNDEDQEMEDDEILSGLVQESTPIPTGKCEEFSPSLSLGESILLRGWETFICLVRDKSLKTVCLNTPESLEKYFRMLQFLLPHVTEETVKSVCIGMTDSFRVKSKDEIALLHYFRTLASISKRVRLPQESSLKLARYFSDTKDRMNRLALCGIFEQEENKECHQAIVALNAFSSTDVELHDFEERSKGVAMSIKILEEGSFCPLSYALLAYNFFFTLKHETQAVLYRQALQVFTKMAEALSNTTNEHHEEVKKFIEEVILREIRTGLQNKEIKVFENYVEVLSIFIQRTHAKHGTLNDLQFLVEGEQGILEGICDIKVNLKTKAMNRLFKALDDMLRQVPFNPIGARVLLAYVLPIAMIHMETRKEGKGSGISMDNVLDNLIDSSIKILKTIMRLLPPKAYVEYLNNQLSNPPRDSKFLKRYKRQLIAVMDGFHYTLREEDEPSTAEFIIVVDEKPVDESNELEPVPLRRVNYDAIESTIQLMQPALVKLQEYLKFKQAASHKLISKWREDDETMVLQVECTVGLVKLLQKLPLKMAKDLMNPIIPTICAYMKSKDHSKRRTTKATLIHLLRELGPTTFPKIVSYLEASLKVGFQLHVLNHVLSSLLTACEASFAKSPRSIPTKSIIAHCENECFGIMAEEKQVGKIVDKTYEARSKNTEPILRICAKYATSIDTLKLLIDAPIKQFEAAKSEKRFSQVKQWLAHVNKGLVQNSLIDCTEVLMWLKDQLTIRGVVTPQSHSTKQNSEPQKKKRKSTYELAAAPSKKINDGPDASAILINEFILQCLYNFLNNQRCTIESAKDFRVLLVEGMKSASKEVLLLSLRCATMLFLGSVYDFETDQDLVFPIWRSVVLALSKYCFAKGDTVNHEMVNAIFKCITEFLKAFPNFKLMKTDLEILVKCIENFLTTGNCSSTALNLLQGVFQMRIKSDAITSLMVTVLKESVRSHSEHVISGCRKAYISYTLIYNTKADNLHSVVEELTAECGRAKLGHEAASIIDTISSMVTEAPLGSFTAVSQKLIWFAFMTITRPLPACSTSGAKLFQQLIARDDFKSGLFDFLELFFTSEFGFPNFKILGCEYLVPALEAQCPSDSSSYKIFTKLLVDVATYFGSLLYNSDIQVKERYCRNIVFAIEATVSHVVKRRGHWPHKGPGWKEWADMIAYVVRAFPDYRDPWIRHKCMQITNTIIRNTSWVDLIVCMKSEGRNSVTHPFLKTDEDLRSMINNQINVIQTTQTEDNIEIAVNNLILCTQLVVKLVQNDSIYTPTSANIKTCVILVNKVRDLIRHEVVKDATNTKMRQAAYQIFQAYIGMLDNTADLPIATPELLSNNRAISEEYLESVGGPGTLTRIQAIVSTAVRDATDRNLEGPVKKTAESLLLMIGKRIGNERFEPIHVNAMKELDLRRKENRTKKAQTAVLHPGLKRKRAPLKANPKAAYVQASKAKKRKQK